ncbi:MAG: glucose-6-phosphate isomerase family protein [Patescibacteria group bacterium]
MNFSTRKLREISDVLLDSEATGPKHIYYMFRNLPFFSSRETRFDLTILPSFFLGKEFNKTYGHVHKNKAKEIYKLYVGTALFLLQKSNKKMEVSEIKLIKAKRGDKVEIPGDYHHCTINIGRFPLVLGNWLPKDTENDYKHIAEAAGFGYYVIRSNEGKLFKLIENKNYEKVPEPRVINMEKTAYEQN